MNDFHLEMLILKKKTNRTRLLCYLFTGGLSLPGALSLFPTIHTHTYMCVHFTVCTIQALLSEPV